MEHRDVFILEDIIEFCNKIDTRLSKIDKSQEAFLDDLESQDLCAFYCLQIGEDANSLSDQFKNTHPEIDWRGIIGLRHNIAHEYGSIDPKILWNILSEEIPTLRDFCTKQIN